ncbi:hypothetical protein TRVL_04781 [Trypanosoma vivax]|nr:hypothetical protein TRVL_04781 [Trypanosoma vivax]
MPREPLLTSQTTRNGDVAGRERAFHIGRSNHKETVGPPHTPRSARGTSSRQPHCFMMTAGPWGARSVMPPPVFWSSRVDVAGGKQQNPERFNAKAKVQSECRSVLRNTFCCGDSQSFPSLTSRESHGGSSNAGLCQPMDGKVIVERLASANGCPGSAKARPVVGATEIPSGHRHARTLSSTDSGNEVVRGKCTSLERKRDKSSSRSSLTGKKKSEPGGECSANVPDPPPPRHKDSWRTSRRRVNDHSRHSGHRDEQELPSEPLINKEASSAVPGLNAARPKSPLTLHVTTSTVTRTVKEVKYIPVDGDCAGSGEDKASVPRQTTSLFHGLPKATSASRGGAPADKMKDCMTNDVSNAVNRDGMCVSAPPILLKDAGLDGTRSFSSEQLVQRFKKVSASRHYPAPAPIIATGDPSGLRSTVPPLPRCERVSLVDDSRLNSTPLRARASVSCVSSSLRPSPSPLPFASPTFCRSYSNRRSSHSFVSVREGFLARSERVNVSSERKLRTRVVITGDDWTSASDEEDGESEEEDDEEEALEEHEDNGVWLEALC